MKAHQCLEDGVRTLYTNSRFSERQYSAIVDGKRVNGVADDVTTVGGKPTAIEAKFVDDWENSLRNPQSPSGTEPWALDEQNQMLVQAKKNSAGFRGGVVYHTNSSELAAHYTRVFNSAGVENFRFVITPTQ